MERQRGELASGARRTEIETDRRIIRDRIALLKNNFRKIDVQMGIQRKNREVLSGLPWWDTPMGKSTLMNLLAKSEVFAENKLFATLDTTVRKVVVENLPFLLTDTVGFIRKLPHHLVESFKSTLDEVREADILMHVVDISHPDFEEQIKVVDQALVELKAANKPVIMVFNKVDAYRYVPRDEDDLSPAASDQMSLEDLEQSWMSRIGGPCLFVSAIQRTHLDQLRKVLYEQVRKIHARRYPYDQFLY